MSRNVVAIVSSVMFVILAALLVVVPIPFVTLRPGHTVNVLGNNGEVPLIEVKGLENFPTESGQLFMTTVSTTRVDARVSLPEALIAHFNPEADAMPRNVVYPAGLSNEDVREEAVAAMDTSRSNAVVAALRVDAQSVTEMPIVSAVVLSSPANGLLLPGDFIVSVDGKDVRTKEDVANVISATAVGDQVVFKVLRDGEEQTVSVATTEGGKGGPVVGVNVGIGFQYTPDVVFRVDSSVVGPSAGLVFSLAIYDKISERNLLGDLVVAGTGTMDPTGRVGAIGGVRQKIAGAEEDGATVFLLPSDNCDDIGDLATEMRLVPVETLKDAIAALQSINEGKSYEKVPTCD
ncbi:MAG: PDZ domain-containing protein [Propionibacteriaceae bacterium]|nr:PDZ domain-containing protein [Propionibacteriaceae bacterium]